MFWISFVYAIARSNLRNMGCYGHRTMKPTKIWGSACWPWDQNQIWWTTLFKPIIIHLCPSMEANSIYAHWFGFLSVGNSSHRLQCLKNKLTHIELYSLVALSAALWFPAPMSINLILYIYIMNRCTKHFVCYCCCRCLRPFAPKLRRKVTQVIRKRISKTSKKVEMVTVRTKDGKKTVYLP